MSDEINLIGDSKYFQQMLEQVSAVAPLNKPILIVGERGTGKELIASRLHYLSKRWDKKFFKLNCATLTESLLESELFGHEAGSFTGAIKRHQGLFELADKGSLFLDELASTSMRIQEKLLRVIEYGEFQRVGGTETLSVDIRIIAASNVDLPEQVEQNNFRADLLDRLAFSVITLPPLRARDQDVLLLAEHFAMNMARELGWPFFSGFSESIKQSLINYDWPGNIRECKNVIERAVYQWADHNSLIGHIVFDPFKSPFRPIQKIENKAVTKITATTPSSLLDLIDLDTASLKENLNQLEKILIEQALQKHQHNQRKTADYLGLTYHQLRASLRKLKDR